MNCGSGLGKRKENQGTHLNGGSASFMQQNIKKNIYSLSLVTIDIDKGLVTPTKRNIT